MKQSPLPRTSPCVVVTMLNRDCDAVFDLVLYGLSTEDVCVVAAPRDFERWIADGREGRRELCGSEYVRAALRRRGLNPDDFTSSPFLVRDGTAERGYLRRDE